MTNPRLMRRDIVLRHSLLLFPFSFAFAFAMDCLYRRLLGWADPDILGEALLVYGLLMLVIVLRQAVIRRASTLEIDAYRAWASSMFRAAYLSAFVIGVPLVGVVLLVLRLFAR